MRTGLEVFVIRQGRDSVDLSPHVRGASWTTNALGGFGSASFTLPGNPLFWVPKTPKLAMVRITQDAQIVFEGQIEDHDLSISQGESNTTVQCFGLARLLTEVPVKRIWSKRNFDWVQRSLALMTVDAAVAVSTGLFDPADPTKTGILFAGAGTTTVGRGQQWQILAPSGTTLVRCMFTYDKAGTTNLSALMWSGLLDSFTNHLNVNAAVTGSTQNFACAANSDRVMFGSGASISSAITGADFAKFYNIRVLGTSLTEDATGGLYGGSVLRDLIALVPGLTLGQIDAGSEFTIEAIERSVRSASLDVVQEVAAYYDKEWGVYENGRFDWKAANLDYVNWILDVSELESLNLRSSVDDMGTVDYVLYTDAATGLEAEASATSTSRANPYVVQGRTRAVLTSPGFPMTANTSAQLASRLNTAHAVAPFASGSCSLSYRSPVSRGGGGGVSPAYSIRAGQNIKILGLPKTNAFNVGRDGETLFHIVTTEASSDGSVTLTLDSQSQAIDSLLARLAAVTRTLTG